MDSPLPRNSGLWPRMALRHWKRECTYTKGKSSKIAWENVLSSYFDR